MTANDLAYFRLCSQLSFIQSPFLEVGSAKHEGLQLNLCDMAKEAGVSSTVGVDLQAGTGVDLTFDFSLPHSEFNKAWAQGQFGTVAIFNTLEHTFDPLTVLQNALHCVKPGGTLVVLAPTVWPIHHYPCDYNRLLPDWFKEFGTRFDLELLTDGFCWISEFGILNMKGRDQLPTFQSEGKKLAPFRYWKSRILHKLFDTYGRTHWATHLAIGVVYRVPHSHEIH